ncbi:MAG: hypothetical protein KGZ39_05685 [Simkania sp.]|nr:hypothetical protein [Simkania sp.]
MPKIKFIEYRGESRTIRDWAKLKGIKPATIAYRLRNGWPIEDALNLDLHSGKKMKHGNWKFHRKEYKTWHGMLERCTDPERYHCQKGIKVLYKDFDEFFQDVGSSPSPRHQIDRIDNDGHYEKGNCRWATAKQNNDNRSNTVIVTYGGITKLLVEWAKELNLNYMTTLNRFNKGWPLEKVFAPRMTIKDPLVTFHGETKTIAQWAKERGIHYVTLRTRLLRYGWSVEDAMNQKLIQGQKHHKHGNSS